MTKMFYRQLKSETVKLAAVKEQILVRYLGLGWREVHHAWSDDRNTFTLLLLLNHLLGVALHLADKLDVPSEPPLNVNDLPQVENVEIVLDLAESLKGLSDDKIAELKHNGRE